MKDCGPSEFGWRRGATGHFDQEFLPSFYAKILVIGDDDNLVLLDETRAPILIPSFTVRIVEVD